MLTSREQVAVWVEKARGMGHIAVDTEFVWERTYYPNLGVVQIGLSADEVELIDAVALPDLGGLGESIADPSVVKILHDAQQDLTIIRRATGAYPRNVFDTRCAAGLVGASSTLSLNGLIKQTLGIELTGTATRTDWLRRPLAERQVSYALDDARYLPQAREALLAQAAQLGRSGWVSEEMAAYEDPSLYDDPDPYTQYERLKGATKLNARQLGIMRELAAWRESEARERNIPRKHVVPDDILSGAAQRNVRSAEKLARIKGTYDRERYTPAILKAIERGGAVKHDDLPQRPERPNDDEVHGAKVDFVLAYAKGKGLAESVDPALVASRSEIADLVRGMPDVSAEGCPLLKGWRGEFVGRELVRLLRGEIAVRLNGETGLPEPAPAAP